LVTLISPGLPPVDITDRAARLLGTLASFTIGSTFVSLAGNVGKALTSGQVFRVKSVVVVTNATVGNRTLTSGGLLVSAKVAAAGSTVDLLDRELILTGTGSTADISIGGGLAGDSWTATLERIL
jgi:hypothetical protein